MMILSPFAVAYSTPSIFFAGGGQWAFHGWCFAVGSIGVEGIVTRDKLTFADERPTSSGELSVESRGVPQPWTCGMSAWEDDGWLGDYGLS